MGAGSAVGVNTLPLDVCTEVEAIIEIEEYRSSAPRCLTILSLFSWGWCSYPPGIKRLRDSYRSTKLLQGQLSLDTPTGRSGPASSPSEVVRFCLTS